MSVVDLGTPLPLLVSPFCAVWQLSTLHSVDCFFIVAFRTMEQDAHKHVFLFTVAVVCQSTTPLDTPAFRRYYCTVARLNFLGVFATIASLYRSPTPLPPPTLRYTHIK